MLIVVNSYRVDQMDQITSGASATKVQRDIQKQLPLLLELSDVAMKHIRAYFPDEKVLAGTALKSLNDSHEADAARE